MLPDSLPDATRQFVKQLRLEEYEMALNPSPMCTEGRADWITLASGTTGHQVGAAAAVALDVAPVVIGYDEISGSPNKPTMNVR